MVVNGRVGVMNRVCKQVFFERDRLTQVIMKVISSISKVARESLDSLQSHLCFQEGESSNLTTRPFTIGWIERDLFTHHNLVVRGDLALPLCHETLPPLFVVLRDLHALLGGCGHADHAAVRELRGRLLR